MTTPLESLIQTGTKVWLDKAIIVETEDHPSAQHPNGVTYAGTAQGGDTQEITLAAGSTSVNDECIGQIVELTGGTGAGQSRAITGIVTATEVASVSSAWATDPDSTTIYKLHPDAVSLISIPSAADNATAVVEKDISAVVVSDSVGVHLKNTLADTDDLQSNGANVKAVAGETIGANGSGGQNYGGA